MNNLSILLAGSSPEMAIVNYATLGLAIILVAWCLFSFILPKQLRILWTGDTIVWKTRVTDGTFSFFYTLSISNKWIVLTYFAICILAIIYFP